MGQYLVKYKTDYDSGIHSICVDVKTGETAADTYKDIKAEITSIEIKSYKGFRIYSIESIFKIN